MQQQNVDSTVVELLPITNHHGDSESQSKDNNDHISNTTANPRRCVTTYTHDRAKFAYIALVVVALAILATLLAMAPGMSQTLALNGCMSSGEFVLPYTSSVWHSRHFWTITVPFIGARDCGTITDNAQACTGFTFSQVKMVDLGWDLLLGRGGQAFLIWMAYHLFSRVIAVLMESGEVAYDVFAAVAFNSGTLGSGYAIARQAVGSQPFSQSKLASWVYATVLMATLYIVALPTLVSAITGYTSYYEPWVFIQQGAISTLPGIGTSITASDAMVSCDGALLPVWGIVGSTQIIVHYNGTLQPDDDTTNWIDYYNRYAGVYTQCPSALNISSCSAANITTWVMSSDGQVTDLEAPMPGIVTWPDTAPAYSYWDCGGEILPTAWFQSSNGSVTGICQAGSSYSWGFSLQLAVGVAVLNLLFALTMCWLWWFAHRWSSVDRDYGILKDAVLMVTQAQMQYGKEIGEWSADTLQKEVVGGRHGMTYGGRSENVEALPER